MKTVKYSSIIACLAYLSILSILSILAGCRSTSSTLTGQEVFDKAGRQDNLNVQADSQMPAGLKIESKSEQALIIEVSGEPLQKPAGRVVLTFLLLQPRLPASVEGETHSLRLPPPVSEQSKPGFDYQPTFPLYPVRSAGTDKLPVPFLEPGLPAGNKKEEHPEAISYREQKTQPGGNNKPNRPEAAPETKMEENRREIFARPGDRLEIILDNEGWLYTGQNNPAAGSALHGRSGTSASMPPAASGASQAGVSFLSRDSKDRKTSFSFQALDLGEYELIFQLQNNTSGMVRNKVVDLKVVPEEEFSALMAESTQPAAGNEEHYAHAERLFSFRELQSALIEFLEKYQEGNPYLNDRIAAIYAKTGEHYAAVKYYRKNLDATGVYADKAVLGLIRSGLALKDNALLLDHLGSFLALNSQSLEEDIIKMAHYQSEDGRPAVAFSLLNEYLKRYPSGSYLDEVYYLLAHLFEYDSGYRDLKKARSLYHKVFDEYPESGFAEESYQRVRYLDRHFFYIQ